MSITWVVFSFLLSHYPGNNRQPEVSGKYAPIIRRCT